MNLLKNWCHFEVTQRGHANACILGLGRRFEEWEKAENNKGTKRHALLVLLVAFHPCYTAPPWDF